MYSRSLISPLIKMFCNLSIAPSFSILITLTQLLRSDIFVSSSSLLATDRCPLNSLLSPYSAIQVSVNLNLREEGRKVEFAS